ncbi:hypothetical protein ACLOJK_007923 [Asimina triloba]
MVMTHKTGDISLLLDVSVELVKNLIEDDKKPSVAAIQRQWAACHARVAAPETQLGCPELSLVARVMHGFGVTLNRERGDALTKKEKERRCM